MPSGHHHLHVRFPSARKHTGRNTTAVSPSAGVLTCCRALTMEADAMGAGASLKGSCLQLPLLSWTPWNRCHWTSGSFCRRKRATPVRFSQAADYCRRRLARGACELLEGQRKPKAPARVISRGAGGSSYDDTLGFCLLGIPKLAREPSRWNLDKLERPSGGGFLRLMKMRNRKMIRIIRPR